MTDSTEISPLLGREYEVGTAIHVLAELIGARHLLITAKRIEPYCVVQFGTRTIHRTKPLMKSTKNSASARDPIWSIKESPLFIVSILPKDLENNKQLVVTIWTRRPRGKLEVGSAQFDFAGKIRIKASTVLSSCTEERLEFNMVDDLGRNVAGAGGVNPLIAIRFRVASEADLRFVQAWNHATESRSTIIPRTILNRTGVLPQEHRHRANLVTELLESEVPGANLGSAISSSVSSEFSPRNAIRVKPCPDPEHPITGRFMSRKDLNAATRLPSRNWIEAGSGLLGKLYLEILSCHGLPNVDIGTAVGNQTDAFVAVVYGDAMVETSIIDDELNPHWPPWTQRAFVLRMLHPSQVLYLSVFGYKRGLLSHAPIGRVEINPVNLQRDTEYNLHYSLFQSSHVTDRKSCGTIRIRLRIQLDSERAVLMAALRPCPEIYVNVRKRKSLPVARYTCCGEYDNEEKFSLRILLSYVDELKETYLRRILYALNDGGQSIIFWRGQVKVGPVWIPLHSFLLFCVGIIVVERPRMVPAFLFLGVAWFMLVNMQLRMQSPSPWHRCTSFGHYLRVLLLGSSVPAYVRVDPGEGWEEQQRIEKALEDRKEEDDRFFEKKEAVEKELEEIEGISLQTKSNAAIIPVELLVVLGKVQAIVGNVCRLCRSVHAIIAWEESVVSFWITSIFLIFGIIFIFIPWGFLLKWCSRLAVLFILGPQNKLLDIYLNRTATDEHKIRELFAARFFMARCHQENAGKLKAFLHILYGKFSTAVPTLMWTPHEDRPLPESEARLLTEKDQGFPALDDLPYIPGQKVYGLMIPRPYEEWITNMDESNQGRTRAESVLLRLNTTPTVQSPKSLRMQSTFSIEEGIEVTDVYDEEAGFVQSVSDSRMSPKRKVRIREESLQGDWGEEIVDTYADEARFVQKSFQVYDDNGDQKFERHEARLPPTVPKQRKMHPREESLRGDWGEEVVDTYADEARFVQQSFRVHEGTSKGELEAQEAGQPNITDEVVETFGDNVSCVPQKSNHDEGDDEIDDQKAQLPPITTQRQTTFQGDHGEQLVDTYTDDARFAHKTFGDPDILATNKTTVITPTQRDKRRMSREESLRGDWGIEIADVFDEEARFVQQSWRGSVHHFPDMDLSDTDGEDSDVEHEVVHLPTVQATQDKNIHLDETSPDEKHSLSAKDRSELVVATEEAIPLSPDTDLLRTTRIGDQNVEEIDVPGEAAPGLRLTPGTNLVSDALCFDETSRATLHSQPTGTSLNQAAADLEYTAPLSASNQQIEPSKRTIQESSSPYSLRSTYMQRDESSEEVGVEIVDIFDEEAAFVHQS
jgi:hypothetical protein